MFLHESGEVSIANRPRAKAFHQNAHGFGNADGVAELHFNPARQACGHEGLGHVAGGIGSGPIHLGGIFAREGAATMACVATVGVHDDFATR